MEHTIHLKIGLDCETLRFLVALFDDEKQHEELIAAGAQLKASTEALQSALGTFQKGK